MNRYPLVFLMLLVSMCVQAQDTRLTTSAKPVAVDSVSDELASIVVLCATRHESGQLHSQWADYLQKHYNDAMDIDALVREITRQATGYWQVRLISASMLGSKSRSGAPISQAEIRAKQKLQDFVRAAPAIEKALRNTARAIVANMTK